MFLTFSKFSDRIHAQQSTIEKPNGKQYNSRTHRIALTINRHHSQSWSRRGCELHRNPNGKYNPTLQRKNQIERKPNAKLLQQPTDTRKRRKHFKCS